MKHALALALALCVAGCGGTEFVATPVDLGIPKSPSECRFNGPDDLTPLDLPNNPTAITMAASVATVHRENRVIFREMHQAFDMCKKYVARVERKRRRSKSKS